MLKISKAEASILLRHFKWDVEDWTFEKWVGDSETVWTTLGLLVKEETEEITSSDEKADFECRQCYVQYLKENMKELTCGHLFCHPC
jgi:hypothetical protein